MLIKIPPRITTTANQANMDTQKRKKREKMII